MPPRELTRKSRRATPGGSSFLRRMYSCEIAGEPRSPGSGRRGRPASEKPAFRHLLQHREAGQRRLGLVSRTDLPHQAVANIAEEFGRRLVIEIAGCVPRVAALADANVNWHVTQKRH